jgi:cardiolipin synthase
MGLHFVGPVPGATQRIDAPHEPKRYGQKPTEPKYRLRQGAVHWPHHHAKLVTATVLVIAAVALLLFLAQDKSTLHVQSALRVEDPRFPFYLATQVNAPVLRGSTFDVLQNGDEIYPPMLEAIRNARHRVEFESYIFAGKLSETFTNALSDAARRGVQVRMVLDGFGVATQPAKLRKRLEESGVQVVWFNGLGTWTIDKANYRTHRKLLVADGSVAFTGGAGVDDKWLGHAEDKDHWRDTQFRVTGPAVATLEAAFFENWRESGGDPAPVFDPPDAPAGQPLPAIAVWSNASEGPNDVKMTYLFAIAGAQQTIDIQSPYFLPDASFRRALDEARQRGVRIRVLTDGDVTDAKSVKSASRAQYAALLDAGDHVFEYQPTMMHVKVMVVDRRFSVFGTANFDNRSFELNDEVAIAADDPALAATLTRAFEQDLTRAKTWTAAQWRQRPFYARMLENFWRPFSEIF